ncbi:ribosome small subunit-dependent GTPase A [Evansella cellulosilytica]|uniref:Small ribosomal subunit biogenesis GTPase RsgA n=1 Tax=Evansella cellulosilytica (strain ATCC 21833 / DSM 2522 / FERM P-1141 / JCM 9156 / N-4) TaxID=649639 RepID=E6TTN6_EVAC2|nr:ribosome small subunit-dependent GTPase A [Evansella cellulosilytica]ADU30805.1 ribosome small subunit-dependent GTPase A [Evansella cellulosilytica DSM 2522]
MAQGRIIKALAGFYYVENEEGIFQCRGRGNFRKRKITPLVGDWVEFEAENKTDGYLLEVNERKNELIRPPISNVDQAILVFSTEEPAFSSLLLDRFLVHVEANQISPIICMSKIDLLEKVKGEEMQQYKSYYKSLDYEVVSTSIFVEETIEDLRPYLIGHVSVFAGQSGVGKSSLLNALRPELNIETAPISKHLGRGKHTTRHVELIKIDEGGYVADTPGFSSLDFQGMEAEDLSLYFPEMRNRINDCKFRGCTHVNEPKCAVKEAVSSAEIATYRYEHYLQFLDEIKSQKRRY